MHIRVWFQVYLRFVARVWGVPQGSGFGSRVYLRFAARGRPIYCSIVFTIGYCFYFLGGKYAL